MIRNWQTASRRYLLALKEVTIKLCFMGLKLLTTSSKILIDYFIYYVVMVTAPSMVLYLIMRIFRKSLRFRIISPKYTRYAALLSPVLTKADLFNLIWRPGHTWRASCILGGSSSISSTWLESRSRSCRCSSTWWCCWWWPFQRD